MIKQRELSGPKTSPESIFRVIRYVRMGPSESVQTKFVTSHQHRDKIFSNSKLV